jgi:SAM-dependent methyltransferase
MATNQLLQNEKRFYDVRWRKSEVTPREQRRVRATIDAIPLGCRRVLDVGAGDGLISNEASIRGFPVVAFDLSTVCLSRLSVPSCCGSAHQLPFADRAFDVVMSTEMLEHLPAALYPGALTELARVADRYILVTVPNRENLTEQLARCGACGHTFHIWGHARAYTPATLANLFLGFKPVQISKIGDSIQHYNRLLLWIRQKMGGGFWWDERTPCYHCGGNTPPVPRRPQLVRIADTLNAHFWARFSRRACWLLALYTREAAPMRGE